MGLQAGLYVLESISLEFLERFMEKTMEKVNQELFYIFALLERVHPTLLEHLEKLVLTEIYDILDFCIIFNLSEQNISIIFYMKLIIMCKLS